MLLRTTDPFRDFDRLTQQIFGTTNRPAVMPMDAWREGDRFVARFGHAGRREGEHRPRRRAQRAHRPRRAGAAPATVTGRRSPPSVRAASSAGSSCSGTTSTSTPSRRAYADGVLRLVIPVAEKAKPRKIQIDTGTTTRSERTSHRGLIPQAPVVVRRGAVERAALVSVAERLTSGPADPHDDARGGDAALAADIDQLNVEIGGGFQLVLKVYDHRALPLPASRSTSGSTSSARSYAGRSRSSWA